MNKLLSVIVPIYNVGQFIDECVKSIVDQSLKEIEIILVNDGSTDESGSICDKWAKEDARIIVIHKENGGLISARQAGLERATGEYITFVDGDDWIDENLYESVFHDHEDTTDMYAFGYTDEYPGEKASYMENAVASGVYGEEEIQNYIWQHMIYLNKEQIRNVLYSPGMIYSVVAKVIKRELIHQILPHIDTRITLGEDLTCSCLCLEKTKRLVVKNEVRGYHYRRNPNSMTRSFDLKRGDKLSYLYGYLSNNVPKKLSDTQLPIHALGIVNNNIRIAFGKSYQVKQSERMQYLRNVCESEYINQVLKQCKENKFYTLNLDKEYQKMFEALGKSRYYLAIMWYLVIRIKKK